MDIRHIFVTAIMEKTNRRGGFQIHRESLTFYSPRFKGIYKFLNAICAEIGIGNAMEIKHLKVVYGDHIEMNFTAHNSHSEIVSLWFSLDGTLNMEWSNY